MLNQRSEPDLLVFISSVMDDELNPARVSAAATIQDMDFGRPWAFEHTPASSEPASDAYLRKLEEADFVIWLVGSRTTQPVVNEVHRCLATHGRLLIFKLPASERDHETETLLKEAGQVVKWKDVGSLSTLGPEIKLALHDEMIRALRDPLGRSRNQSLGRTRDRSLADCVVSLLALGVDEDVANNLVYKEGVGHDLDELDPGLYVVTGPQGCGKTLAAHRLFQRTAQRALDDASEPFPMLINSADLLGGLWETIDSRCRGNVDPQSQPLMVILDAVDERGPREATTLVRQMESYANANPKTTLVATTRPLTGFVHTGTTIEIPVLDDQQLVHLVAEVSGSPPEKIDPRFWRNSLKETSRFPLFAIMIGAWLRDNSQVGDLSRRELVEHLGRAALGDNAGDNEETDRLLQILATKAVTYGTRVRLHEVTPSLSRQQQLLGSRMVHQSDGAIDFALPIFREWYAARAVLEGTIPVEEIDLESDRWTIPLSIAAHSDNLPMAQGVMQHLASTNPSVASEVLREDERVWYSGGSEPSLPKTTVGVGEEIRRAMGAWSDGLGPLFNEIGPVDSKGALSTLGLRFDGDWLGISWYCGPDHLPPVIEFTDDYNPIRFDADWEMRKDWPTFSGGPVPPTELWNWVKTKSSLVQNLSEALQRRRLSYHAADAVKELVWAFALDFSNTGSLYEGPIQASAVLERIQRLPNDPRMTLGTLGGVYVWDEIEIVRDYLSRLCADGQDTISSPWPTSNLPFFPSSVWSRFSDERLLEHTSAVYGAALRIYQGMVEQWFAAFASRLRLYRLLPVRLEGSLSRPPRGGMESPWLDWKPVILESNERSHVSFVFEAENTMRGQSDDYFAEQRDAFANFRQGDTERLALFQSFLALDFDTRPATNIAYNWLHDELRDLGWVQ